MLMFVGVTKCVQHKVFMTLESYEKIRGKTLVMRLGLIMIYLVRQSSLTTLATPRALLTNDPSPTKNHENKNHLKLFLILDHDQDDGKHSYGSMLAAFLFFLVASSITPFHGSC